MRVVQRAVPGAEAVGLHALAAERLDDPHPGDALLQRGQHHADAVAHREVGPVRVALELDARQHHERDRDEADEQELPAHRRRSTTTESTISSPFDRNWSSPHLDELLQRVDVRGHAGHDHAGLLAVVVRHRQLLEVVEHPEAEVAQEPSPTRPTITTWKRFRRKPRKAMTT